MRQRERRIFLTLDVLKTSQRHHRLEAPLPRQVVVKLSRLAQQGEEVTRGAFNLDVTLASLANDVDDRAELDEPPPAVIISGTTRRKHGPGVTHSNR